ncbi:penicillin-binding protein 1C [Stappia sediminis]|uniref:penicillin-binding protein 1C n=1 Tax=Stappia sediminis TaxID=2692190 RepID=UPI001FCACFC3|nr:penicillin-binding protein 1C [Stappia sediminis]
MALAVAGLGLCLIVVLGCGAWLAAQVGKADPLGDAGEIAVSRNVLDRNGVLLRAFQTSDDKWRLPVAPGDVDSRYLAMLKAYEDRRFDAHAGVDARALARAAVQAARNGGIVSGGSTLTMQVARLLKEKPTRTLTAKLEQIVDALALERTLTKDEILSLYLLRAPYGGNIEGVRAASLAWLGKEPARLTAAEAALLVALPQSPEARRPDRHREAARFARDRVIDRMVAAGVLGAGEAAAAKRDPVPSRRRDVPLLAAHAAREAILHEPASAVVRLTIDARLQASLENLAKRRAAGLGRNASVAILVADHTSGEVLARVGSAGLLDERRRGHVDMAKAVRSPGSTLKPLIYGLAFEEGIAHPESFVEDRPSSVNGYSPTNFDRTFQGTVTVREALQHSLNIPAVKLLEAVGSPVLLSRLRLAGVHVQFAREEAPGLALALGGLGVSLWDLAELYAAIANEGRAVDLFERDAEHPRSSGGRRVLDAVAAWYVGDILSGMPAPRNAPAEGIAYKTGTSYGHRDAWAVGFDGRHVVAVWAGRADGTPISAITGYGTAAPILSEAFQRLGPERYPLAKKPAGVLTAHAQLLPPPLKYARVGGRKSTIERGYGPEIAFPPEGALLDLGMEKGGAAAPLVVKLRRGTPPFAWYANGRPVSQGGRGKSLVWMPDGPGRSTIAVVDAHGGSARVSVDLR